jgi:uncharacterized protein CbrC (UPF0167 family)
MEQTFADLGIPFPLFEAPIKDTTHYRGVGQCSLCSQAGVHLFEPTDVSVVCSHCATATFVIIQTSRRHRCRSCGGDLHIPNSAQARPHLLVCYDCLRAGNAAICKMTVLGMVTWEQAQEGMTHGVPGLERDDFELVPVEDEPEWLRAVVPSDLLWELLRTPGYTTWQGEQWQFCCKQPMIYVGEWKEDDFDRRAPGGNGEAFFRETVLSDNGLEAPYPELWGELARIGGPYMFRCSTCGKHSGHWDID